MSDSNTLRIGHLPRMRVARCKVRAENPEEKAFERLIGWAGRNNATITEETRFFGFNDPCPAPGQKVYAYEAWMTVDRDTTGSEDVEVFDFPGGTYAVKGTALPKIGEAWHSLAVAVRESGHNVGRGPALEEAVTQPGKMDFNSQQMVLYLPVYLDEK